MRFAPWGGRSTFAIVAALAVALLLLARAAVAATVLYVYDDLGRLIAEIDAAGATTRYTYDPAGNLLSVTRDSSTQFRVDGFTPASGKAGDSVTLFGAGFIADPAQNTVSFNGTPANIALATANSLVAIVPGGAASGPIAVSNANGSGVTAQAFSVISPPVITAVTPSSVSRGATTRADVHGSQLASAREVTFTEPGISARIVSHPSDQRLTIDLTVAGTVATGSYPFSVSNFGGTTSSGSVTVTVSTAVLGDALSVSKPISVHLRAAEPGAPAGNRMSAGSAVSVSKP
ncbi:MAG TPA: IPT/TIG domain-containing protein [Steroidobacteraceae bacterium]